MRRNFIKVSELYTKIQDGTISVGKKINVVGTVYLVRKKKDNTIIWLSNKNEGSAIIKVYNCRTSDTVSVGDKVWVTGILSYEATYGNSNVMFCMKSNYLQTNIF